MAGSEAVDHHFREGLELGELRLQRCHRCGEHQFYPRVVCSHCGSHDLDWVVARGRGQVASFTIVRRAVSRDFEAPYAMALVDLEEGVRLMTHIVDVDPEAVSCGMPVTLDIRAIGPATKLPVFSPIR